MAFDLTTLPAYYVATYGVPKIAEILGKPPSVVAMWLSKNKVPLNAVAQLLDFDPNPLSAIRPLYVNPQMGDKLMVCVPLSGPPAPKMMDSLIRLFDKREMCYERFAFNCLSVSRAVLAARFLASPCEWSWWQDGDALCPAGDAEWYKREAELPDMPDIFAEVHSIWRALVHKKTIVSSCYVGRKKGAAPQFGGGGESAMRALVRKGGLDKLIEVPWAGMGGMLIHRSVFEDIIKTQGAEIRMKAGGIGDHFGYKYAFFHPFDAETPGDDLPFCHRAIKAGHKVYVDLAIQAAHVGDRPFTHKDC